MKGLLLYHTISEYGQGEKFEFFISSKQNSMHANAKGRFQLFVALKIGNTCLQLSGCKLFGF